jgi:murein DD-endopeptidase MepM/ murein hydrolase activator NlpD
MEICMSLQNSSFSKTATTAAFKRTRFTEMLIDANGLDQNAFECWVFCPGMLFESPEKWWGDGGRRDFPHEGIDFCLYGNRASRVFSLDEKTRIPAMHAGVVKAIFADYLGKALVIEHALQDRPGGRFLSVYAHTKPENNIEIGTAVKEGEVIATIADTARSKTGILPHLHFSLGLPAPLLGYESFVWNIMRTPNLVTLLDPLGLIDCPHQLRDDKDPCCIGLLRRKDHF